MATQRFRNAASQQNDPMRVPPTLGTKTVPAIQPPRHKLVMLDDDDPGYTSEHALRTKEGKALLLSHAAEMHLITTLMEHDHEHDEATAREALAQLVAAHNLRASAQRADADGALGWLKEHLVKLAPQWNPSELAQALNAREEVRREAAKASRKMRQAMS